MGKCVRDSYPATIAGLASIRRKANTHGAGPLLTQAFIVRRWTTTSPGSRCATSLLSISIRNTGSIAYTLTCKNVGVTLPRTGTVLFAHIHLGKSPDSGGILVFFCTKKPFTGTGPTPPSCNTDSSGSGTVSGLWKAANDQAIQGQNVQAGDFDALVDALTSNTAYANIHTTSGTTPDTAFPGGEIRGQCRSEDRENQHD